MAKRPHHFILGHDGYATTRQCVGCGRIQYAYHFSESRAMCSCDLTGQIDPECPALWWHPPIPKKCQAQRIRHER